MARLALAAAALLSLAASALAACSPATARYFGGATSVTALENQVLSTCYTTYGCYDAVNSGTGYSGFKNNTYKVAASTTSMTTAQESALGFTKLTVPQGLQSFSVLYNGATALTLSAQSLADLYSGFSVSIGGGAITVPVARSDTGAGATYVFTSYLNLATATGPRPWPSSKVGDVVAWGSPRLVTASGSNGVASYVFSHPGSVTYLSTSVAVTFVTGNIRIAATNNKAGQNYKGDSCSITGAIPVSLPAATATWSGVNTIFQAGSGVCPIVTFVYLWARTAYPAGGTPTATITKNFLTSVFSTSCQNVLPPLNFVPVPSSLLTQNRNAIATIH
eukprot:SM000336S12813  [mRNA]  locus=s336:3934:5144:+ [translate_table: standard]